MTPAASREVGEVTERQCAIERMLAHGLTAKVRVERYAGR
jgi:sulfopropanediol 3-dehydrogenase